MAAKTKAEIDWENEALAALRTGDGWSIVRPTLDGRFAVIVVSGKSRRVLKILPTLDRARAYNFAVAR